MLQLIIVILVNRITLVVEDVLNTYLVYGGKSQTLADNLTDDGTPVLEINEIIIE